MGNRINGYEMITWRVFLEFILNSPILTKNYFIKSVFEVFVDLVLLHFVFILSVSYFHLIINYIDIYH